MTLYFIGGGVLIFLFVMWKYGSLIKNTFKLKSAEREAGIHAKINEKNKELDKKAKIKHNEIENIDPDDMLSWLQKKMKPKNKEKK